MMSLSVPRLLSLLAEIAQIDAKTPSGNARIPPWITVFGMVETVGSYGAILAFPHKGPSENYRNIRSSDSDRKQIGI